MMKSALFTLLQHLLPQHLLSRVAGFIAENRTPWIKNRLIDWFIRRYQVDMSCALQQDPHQFQHFNDFFTRALAPGARPISSATQAIVCPADGAISQAGNITNGYLFQAKNHEYSLLELLGGDTQIAKQFINGSFATIYLSPKDYHRVHMPCAGQLTRMIHVPGDLYSVNQATAETVPRLFSRNERVVAIFDTDAGSMALILVGAMITASIETSWAGVITPRGKKRIHTTHYDAPAVKLDKGEEAGLFKLGSTAIVLFAKDCVRWHDEIQSGTSVQMGQAIATIAKGNPCPKAQIDT